MHVIRTINGSKVCVIGISDGEDEENGTETIFEELMTEKFPKK